MNKVTLPLSPTDMVGFFNDKSTEYLIDYHASVKNLNNPKFLLMYIANLGLSCNIDIITPELLLEYMQLKEFSEVQNLKRTHANVLYLAKHGDMLYTDHDLVMPMDDCIAFIINNRALLMHQMAFVNSIPLYMMTRLGVQEGDECGPLKKQLVQHTSNCQYEELGYSLIKLFTIKDFLLAYLHTNIPIEDQIYFTRYFDEYMFNGGNIFSYVFNEKNAYAGLFDLAAVVETEDTTAANTINTLMTQMQAMIPPTNASI